MLADSSDLTFSGGYIHNPVGRSATLVVAASNASATVKAQADYVCDGTADNVEIQAALDALGTYKGTVQLSEGQFYIAATLYVDTWEKLKGHGNGTRLIDAGSTIMLRPVASAGWVEISDMYIDGNDAATYCIQGNTSNNKVWLRNLIVTQAVHTGIRFGSSVGGILIDNVQVTNCANAGLYLTNPHSTSTIRESIFGNIVEDGEAYMTDYAVAIIGAQDIYISDTETWGATIGFYASAAHSVHLRSCRSWLNKTYNYDLETCTYCSLIDCESYASGQDSGTGYGIVLNNTTYTLVDGCTSTKNLGWIGVAGYTEDVQVRGLSEAGTSDYNKIINSKSLVGSAAPLTKVGANTLISNNTGYIAQGEVRTASGSLTAGVANAITFAWHNPEAQDIIIRKVVVEITTGSVTANSVIDVGIADDATGANRGTEFFDDLDANDVDVNDSWVAGDGGTQTKWVFCQDSASATDGWVVGQILVADAAALVGKYYIEYVGR